MTKHKFVEVKSANLSGVFQVIANKGICWQVQDEAGDTLTVQKKHVVRGPWEEEVLTDQEQLEAEAADLAAQRGGSLAASLAQVEAANGDAHKEEEAKEKAAPAERDPNLVTLKELCHELNVVPRIARRVLRKALGNVGTGSRWEWTKDSEDLAKVKAALNPPKANPMAAALDVLNMTQEQLEEGMARSAEQGAEAAEADDAAE